ncbi:MAG TPA: hypothetical protein VHZ55_05385, partial [Bryobacteraceae bacterium]|nr:hypothetical protein [Bryobacteraceae bacterium]
MTPRSIRRAAERRAVKLARKQSQTEPRTSVSGPETGPQPSESVVSEARLAANQANAQLSTGPRTEEGKARSSANAITTALTGRT